MPGPVDTAPCEVCGKVTTRERRYLRGGGRAPHRCLQCAIGVSIDHMDQMRRREGPAYEAWKQAMTAYADRLRDSG